MVMIAATHPARGLRSQVSTTTATIQRRPWGFWATLAWFAAAVATLFAANFLCNSLYAVWWAIAYPGLPVGAPSVVLGFVTLAVSTLAIVLVLVLAARLAGFMARDYLGLRWPHWRHILLGFGLLAAFGFLFVGLRYLLPSLDQSAVWISVYRSVMGNTSALVLFWIMFVVAAPIAEEILFRGFLMRGWSESRLGAAGTVVLTSLIFAAVHTHHGLTGMALVFASAFLFGLMRWQSGSTVLPIMMHAARNLTVGVWVALAA
jgi:membrane protease YdiL (CAAX protease family)